MFSRSMLTSRVFLRQTTRSSSFRFVSSRFLSTEASKKTVEQEEIPEKDRLTPDEMEDERRRQQNADQPPLGWEKYKKYQDGIRNKNRLTAGALCIFIFSVYYSSIQQIAKNPVDTFESAEIQEIQVNISSIYIHNIIFPFFFVYTSLSLIHTSDVYSE